MKKQFFAVLLCVVLAISLLLTVAYAAADTTAVKSVTNEASVTASGSAATPYVSVAGAGASVTYTLEVTNTTTASQNKETRSLVIIDELPRATGDTGVVNRVDRGSQFSVLFDADPDVSVYKVFGLSQTQVDSANYTVRYGSSVGELNAVDWSDSATGGCIAWGEERSGKNAIRIAFDPEYALASGETLLVIFSADAGDDAAFGQTAWNSSGYSYQILTAGVLSEKMYAEPPRVGVRVPGAQITVEKAVTGDPAHPATPFTFLLKQGGAPLADVAYMRSGSDTAYRTGADGSFSLTASQTVTLFVPSGSGYTVEETSLPANFTPAGISAAAPGDGTYAAPLFTFKPLSDEDAVGAVCTNSYSAPTVTAVRVSPEKASVVTGKTQLFSATVAGESGLAQTVDWTVEGHYSASTTISAGGVLSVGRDETAKTLTVKATSTANITKSGTATVTVRKPSTSSTSSASGLILYQITKGQNGKWTKGSKDGLSFTAEAEYARFTGVSVDGAAISSDMYTVRSGSTIVTLKSAYLATLSAGQHTLRVNFTDGYAETAFTVQTVSAPVTGDDAHIALWLGLLLMAGTGLAVCGVLRRKRQNG